MIKDLNGGVTIWSPGAERLFGYAAEEAIGQAGRARRPHKLSTLIEKPR
jgi:PAS domain S-box-containing protein